MVFSLLPNHDSLSIEKTPMATAIGVFSVILAFLATNGDLLSEYAGYHGMLKRCVYIHSNFR